MEFKDYIAVSGLVVSAIGLFNILVIQPLRNATANNQAAISSLTEVQNGLRVDHAVLSTTMDQLTKTLDKLADKLEKI